VFLCAFFAWGCESELDGAPIWDAKCALCHGDDARGGVGSTPDIRQMLADMTVAEIEDTILNGSENGNMIQISVTDAEATAVATWAKENLARSGAE
jgi:mono/diheme cytochrome c family protein